MGICISMERSKATTREEWSKVYNETLELIRCLPLADMRRFMEESLCSDSRSTKRMKER